MAQAGRPQKHPDDQISTTIPIKFSKIDLFRIKERARVERLPVSTFIRKVILDFLNHK